VPDNQDADARSRALERMTFFSDAVIAIALTLLALELPVPEADGPRELLRALTGAHGREYLAFLLAFVLVGASWIAHHQLFSHVAGIDDRLLVLNLVALLGSCSSPGPARPSAPPPPSSSCGWSTPAWPSIARCGA
jgi:uncharacterized membrane protein